MNRNITNTTKGLRRLAFSIAIVLLSFAAGLIAHGGFDHVIGTVVSVENNVLTVKTVKGNVEVRLNDQTEITRGDQKAQVADLKPGVRVVVDIPEGSKEKMAHSVKVGASTPAGAHAHSPQK